MGWSESPPVKFNLEKASILLFDGESMSSDILAQILLGFGATNIRKAHSGETAKKFLTEQTFDLVIVDPSQTGADGYDLIPWIRRNAKQANRFASVLMVTGHTQASKVAAARDAGANFVVAKPLTPSIVFQRIMWLARDARPFVDCRVYAGPDRRFKFMGPPTGSVGRRQEDAVTTVGDPSAPNMSQEAIDAMMQPMRVQI